MQTDTICAFQLEAGDFILGKDKSVAQVIEMIDDRDLLEFEVLDRDSEVTESVHYAPFDVVTIITSFEEE